jgi:sensor histidine kinase YesM
MKAPALYDFMNQRKPVSHITFLIFSLVVTIILAFTRKYTGPLQVSLSVFIMIFAQLEAFIYFGNRLFARLNFDRSPGEITRVVLVRFMIFLAACLLASMIIFILLLYSVQLINGENLSKVFYNFIHYEFRNWFKSTITGLSAGAIIFVVLLWQTSLRREQKLREESLIFQNETLKNQVNPHFLFNSLNTLSSLVNTQPEVAEKFINRLSSIYRYILENISKDKVSLEAELSFIRDYFFLHKIRDVEKIELQILVNDTDKFEILPVSLQILVENAIKHNKATREEPLRISIFIEGQQIVVKNNLQKMATQIRSTGIGLKNLAERVKLIFGRELIIEETNNYFVVKVPLLS